MPSPESGDFKLQSPESPPNPTPAERLFDRLAEASRLVGTKLPKVTWLTEVSLFLNAYKDEILTLKGSHPRSKCDKRPTQPACTDEQWLADLAQHPAYVGIDVRREWDKCRVWTQTNKRALPTRRGFVNWLNKAERPISSTVSANNRPNHTQVATEPANWRKHFDESISTLPWDRIPTDTRAAIQNHMKSKTMESAK